VVIPAAEAALQRGTLPYAACGTFASVENKFTRRGGLETFFHKIVIIRNSSKGKITKPKSQK